MKKIKTISLIFIALLSFKSIAQTEAILERSYVVVSEKKSLVEAKKEIQDKANLNAVEDLARELIGEERFLKNKNLIQTKVLSKAARFIPFYKASEPVIEKNGLADKVTQTIQLKISLSDFKNTLKEFSLLEEAELKLTLIPVISFENLISNKNYKWWLPRDESNKKLALTFEDHWQRSLNKFGIYLVRPTYFNLAKSLPESLKIEKYSSDDLMILGKWFQSSMAIEGQVVVKNSEKKSDRIVLILKLNIIQLSQQKIITDIQRQYEISTKELSRLDSWIESQIISDAESITADLAQQLNDSSQKGLLTAQKIRVKFAFNAQPMQIEMLKEKMRVLSMVKNIKEREISSQEIIYDVDFSGSIAELQNKILATDISFINSAKINFVKANETEINYDIIKK